MKVLAILVPCRGCGPLSIPRHEVLDVDGGATATTDGLTVCTALRTRCPALEVVALAHGGKEWPAMQVGRCTSIRCGSAGGAAVVACTVCLAGDRRRRACAERRGDEGTCSTTRDLNAAARAVFGRKVERLKKRH